MVPSCALSSKRTALLDQLLHTVDEVEAARPLIVRLPQAVLEARPAEGGFSIKELYGSIATWDTDVFTPAGHGIATGAAPDIEKPAAMSWQEYSMADVLGRVVEARLELVSLLQAEAPEAWERYGELWGAQHNLYSLAHVAALHSASVHRRVAQQLKPVL